MNWDNEKGCLVFVKQNGWALQLIKNQTNIICLTAIEKYSLALRFVKNQTPEICMAAVAQNSYTLRYVDKEKFPEVYYYYKLLRL